MFSPAHSHVIREGHELNFLKSNQLGKSYYALPRSDITLHPKNDTNLRCAKGTAQW